MDDVEGHVDGFIEGELRTAHIDGRHIETKRTQRIDDSFAGLERNFSLRAGTTHEHRDLLFGQVDGH